VETRLFSQNSASDHPESVQKRGDSRKERADLFSILASDSSNYLVVRGSGDVPTRNIRARP